MAVVDLTEAKIKGLALGSGIHRDRQVKGLMVVCHATTKTYAVQGDVRRNGRLVRTVRVKIDRCDRINLAEARRRAKALMSQIQSGVDPTARPAESGITLREAVERHIAERRLSPTTEASYRYHLQNYLKGLRSRAVADITRQDVRDLLDRLTKRHGKTTAAGAMRTLRAAINTARRIDETIPANPVEAVRIPTPPRREVDEIDLAEWWAKTEALPPIRRDLHRLLLFTGLRRRSATTIARDDVDIARKLIRVRHMKSGRPFLLPLSDFLVEMLKARMAEDEPLESEWLWPSATSRSGHIEEPKEDGLPSPHAYRHLWRTNAIAAGVPYAESALLLDHRLPGASGGYVHAEHLVEQLRKYQEAVTAHLLTRVHAAG